MNNKVELQKLVEHFDANIDFYKDTKKAYNEHSCRIEFIDPFLKILGWDVANENGAAPQYREVIAENYSSRSDRPDYTMTLRGVAKFFVEAKKPSPFVELDFSDRKQKEIHDSVVAASHRIYSINAELMNHPAKRIAIVLQDEKNALIHKIQGLIERVYRLEY